MRVGRRPRRVAAGLLVLLLASLFPACGGVPFFMPAASKMPWSPQALLDLESSAEAATQAALSGDARKASSDAARVVQLWPEVRKAVAGRKVDPALISRADAVVGNLSSADPADALGFAEKANQASGYAAAFMNLFRMTVPATVPTLDFQARAALIQARAGQWKAVEAYVGALDGTMMAYFPTARAKPPENLKQLEKGVALLAEDANAQDASALERDARTFIAEVAKLRKSYQTGN